MPPAFMSAITADLYAMCETHSGPLKDETNQNIDPDSVSRHQLLSVKKILEGFGGPKTSVKWPFLEV